MNPSNPRLKIDIEGAAAKLGIRLCVLVRDCMAVTERYWLKQRDLGAAARRRGDQRATRSRYLLVFLSRAGNELCVACFPRALISIFVKALILLTTCIVGCIACVIGPLCAMLLSFNYRRQSTYLCPPKAEVGGSNPLGRANGFNYLAGINLKHLFA